MGRLGTERQRPIGMDVALPIPRLLREMLEHIDNPLIAAHHVNLVLHPEAEG